MLTKAIRVSEAHVEGTCSDWLVYDGWRTLKTNPVSNKSRGAGFGELGMADRLYIRYGAFLGAESPQARSVCQLMWIEWKAKDGALAPHQESWHYAERARGGFTLIAGQDFPKTIEGFQTWYRTSGLMRRKI